LCFLVRVGMWAFSRFCRKNSARRPEVGAPMARPFFCITMSLLLKK
jgi:hypothetical protein